MKTITTFIELFLSLGSISVSSLKYMSGTQKI